jgi:hypothetical protein
MGGDATDLLAGILKTPIQRGLLLLLQFMNANAQSHGAAGDAARAKLSVFSFLLVLLVLKYKY